jgi:hypothetical protein
MNSILAFSASHLAWITRNQDTKHLAYHHRGVAIKGLQKAIGAFSKENCDAILAASILLSWQTTEWYDILSVRQATEKKKREILTITAGRVGRPYNRDSQQS